MAIPEAGEKLFLIDAMSLIFRAYHVRIATPLLSSTGMPTQAIYIFVRILRKLLKKYRPAYVALAFDLAAPTFRDKLFEEYKANRPAFPEELSVQLPYVRRFCGALGIPLVEKEGFEADDVIGTLAKKGAGRGLDVSIVSGDEDHFQLVDDRTVVLKPSGRSGEDETLYDAEWIERRAAQVRRVRFCRIGGRRPRKPSSARNPKMNWTSKPQASSCRRQILWIL